MPIYRESYLNSQSLATLMGRNIRRFRIQQNLTQEQLAELADIDQKHVSCIEMGRVCSRISTYLRIANIFNVSIDSFLTEAILTDVDHIDKPVPFGGSEHQFLQSVMTAFLSYIENGGSHSN